MIIDTHGKQVDPFAPLGECAICGADAWATTTCGLLCPSHEAPTAPQFQVREYPNGQPSTITDRGILVSEHQTWAEAQAKAEKLYNEDERAVYVCRASEAQPKAIRL